VRIRWEFLMFCAFRYAACVFDVVPGSSFEANFSSIFLLSSFVFHFEFFDDFVFVRASAFLTAFISAMFYVFGTLLELSI